MEAAKVEQGIVTWINAKDKLPTDEKQVYFVRIVKDGFDARMICGLRDGRLEMSHATISTDHQGINIRTKLDIDTVNEEGYEVEWLEGVPK